MADLWPSLHSVVLVGFSSVFRVYRNEHAIEIASCLGSSTYFDVSFSTCTKISRFDECETRQGSPIPMSHKYDDPCTCRERTICRGYLCSVSALPIFTPRLSLIMYNACHILYIKKSSNEPHTYWFSNECTVEIFTQISQNCLISHLVC